MAKAMKKTIHTTMSIETYNWLIMEKTNKNCCLNDIIESAIEFYIKNKDMPEKFLDASILLRQFVRDEIKRQMKNNEI